VGRYDGKLDAYGHLEYTVGHHGYLACFDARRVGDAVEYHVVIDCPEAHFTDTVERGTVPATSEGIASLLGLPDKYLADCREQYPEEEYGPPDAGDTADRWAVYLRTLIADPAKMYLDPDPVDPEEDES
jgi:hypothetical protein